MHFRAVWTGSRGEKRTREFLLLALGRDVEGNA
jgi:hypothetical protein